MRAILFTVLAVSALLAWACARAKVELPPINTQLSRSADVTGDKVPETITLRLKAANYQSPFLWTLTIDSGDTTIFERDSDDTDIDPMFDDRETLPLCPDYATCKQQYYYREILDNLIVQGYDPELFLDREDGKSMYYAARDYLRDCCNLTASAAEKILRGIESRLRARTAIVISVPVSPAQPGPPLVWAPEAREFVPVYEE